MSSNNLYAFKKVVDWSLLTDGITLTNAFREMIYELLPSTREKGSSQKVHIVLDHTKYEVNLNNVGFSETDYPDHKDILQFRYSRKSKMAFEFQNVFKSSYAYILQNRTKGKYLVLPENLKEYVVFYFTSQPDTFIAECIFASDIAEEQNSIQQYNETQVEEYLNYYMADQNSGIINKLGN